MVDVSIKKNDVLSDVVAVALRMCNRLSAESVSTFYLLKHNLAPFFNYRNISFENDADITVAAKRRKRRYKRKKELLSIIYSIFLFVLNTVQNLFIINKKLFNINLIKFYRTSYYKRNKLSCLLIKKVIDIRKSWKFVLLLFILISIFCSTLEASTDIIVTEKFKRPKIIVEKKQQHLYRSSVNQKQNQQQKQKHQIFNLLQDAMNLNNYNLFFYQFKQNQTLFKNVVEEEKKVVRFVTRRHIKYDVSLKHPIHILFPLPTESGRKEVNPFGITIDLSRPVVDEAINEVYRRQLVPLNSLAVHFEDSRLSDAHGPNVAINQLVDNRLDCIIGKNIYLWL